ncbi:MAG: response regulator, partial [Clostridiales bacterium]|nr:response regulator [Clostridiales bacterium]
MEKHQVLTVLVADDEPELLGAVCQLIDWESLGFRLVGRAGNGLDALQMVEALQPDFLLTDIRMPFISGTALTRQAKAVQPLLQVAFLSGYDDFEYAKAGIEDEIVAYLLKPISPKTLYPILDQLYLGEQRPQDGLTVKGGKVLFRIPFSQLAYVEVNHKHLYFNLTDGSVREVDGVLKQYEDQLLAREEFMRIHRSYIVNMLQIETFAPTEVRTFSGKALPISRLIYPQLQKDY